MVSKRWQVQEEALAWLRSHPSAMLDMSMGTGKTRTVIDYVCEREDIKKVLIVCPLSTIRERTWENNLRKFATRPWRYWGEHKASVKKKAELISDYLDDVGNSDDVFFCAVNYEIIWRQPLDMMLLRACFDLIVLDESHRIKAAGSKQSRYAHLLGKRVRNKICLSGTPMANSPLDIYGQYRFLDSRIFGTRVADFKEEYAVFSGGEPRFIVGFKNLDQLREKFRILAYTCDISDVASQIKLPEAMPDVIRTAELPLKATKIATELKNDFFAAYEDAVVAPKNVLERLLRLQQLCSGFVVADNGLHEVHDEKIKLLADVMQDISGKRVVFCNFRHDISLIRETFDNTFEVSGQCFELNEWKEAEGDATLIVQIQSGAESIDLTNARYAIYYSLPHSLALYEQSRARIYRPGQMRNTVFIHLLMAGTVDERIYRALYDKKDVIEAIRDRSFMEDIGG